MIRSLLCSLFFPVLLLAQTEDYTTYTEVDENGDFTVTADTITVVTMEKEADSYIYKDAGVGHVSGDYTYLVEFNVDENETSGEIHPIATSNSIGTSGTIDAASGDVQFFSLLSVSAVPSMLVVDIDGGTFNNSSVLSLSEDTDYWATMVRDESISAFGDIAISIYDDSGRTNLIGTRNLNLSTSKKDFRYIYATQSKGGAGDTWTGKIYDLDLQEAVTPKRRKIIIF